jgi:hypothetical protein
MVALFPEGISHDEPSMQPLRTGAARIALGAVVDDGVPDVDVVAVGLIYDDKAKFRSRALVRVGRPVPVERWAESYRTDGPAAVRQMTEELAGMLRSVTPDYRSWAEADRLARLADILVRPRDAVLPVEAGLDERERVAAALAHIDARALAPLLTAFDTYQRDLDSIGLDDSQVAASFRAGRLRPMLLTALAKVALAAPVAAVGLVLHAVPYVVVKQVARLPRNEGVRATVKILGHLVLCTVTYVVVGLAVADRLGAVAGVIAALVAPLCGYVALRLVERVRRIGGALQGFRWARQSGARGGLLHTVTADRASVLEAARSVPLGQVPQTTRRQTGCTPEPTP